jgi:hypothetical protein
MILNGKCHCGNIAFELDWPGDRQEIPARACDCSLSVKHGGGGVSCGELLKDPRPCARPVCFLSLNRNQCVVDDPAVNEPRVKY